ncbi:MAG: D-alanyl-D-alanine carboxypeptidase [Blautia sp.]|nr:D-alanyl-D-alanine carboxypeptidase [Blautia sp.]
MKKRYMICFLMCIILMISLQSSISAEEEMSPAVTTNWIEGWPQGPDVSSAAAVLLNSSTDTVLYAKNQDALLDPGSTVKILTVLLALENSSLTDEVTMTQTGVGGVTEGGINLSSQLGEVFTMEQCLYAILLYSANDLALQVAEQIGQSVEGFVAMMNARAASLGCSNSVFTNPTGLEDPAQHSTARDMALIMQAAIQNQDFCRIAKTASYTIPATNVSGGSRVLTNTLALSNTTSPYYYSDCIGGKEGYTETSGNTLLCAARKDDMTLVVSLLSEVYGQIDQDAIDLFNYGFDEFYLLDLGNDDFEIASGGEVILPYSANASSLIAQDYASGKSTIRTYSYNGINVGQAKIKRIVETDTEAIARGEENMKAAYAFSASKSTVPYYLIGGVALFLIILLLVYVFKVVKG